MIYHVELFDVGITPELFIIENHNNIHLLYTFQNKLGEGIPYS